MKRIEIRRNRKLCVGCQEHQARFQYHGQVRWDRMHDMCFRCWRSLMDHRRAELTGIRA